MASRLASVMPTVGLGQKEYSQRAVATACIQLLSVSSCRTPLGFKSPNLSSLHIKSHWALEAEWGSTAGYTQQLDAS